MKKIRNIINKCQNFFNRIRSFAKTIKFHIVFNKISEIFFI